MMLGATTFEKSARSGLRVPVNDTVPGIRPLLVCCVLAFVTVALYWPVRHYPFINYDDNFYVTENHVVTQGVTLRGLQLAVQGVHASNWHPLTTISHLIDCQIWGLRAGPPHAENVLLHASSVALLFLILMRASNAFWPSAAIAALFGWHPLRVESVTWISERKDVLSTFLLMLTLLAYVNYARETSQVRNASGEEPNRTEWDSLEDSSLSTFHAPRSTLFYILSLVLFVLGLMSKAMLVSTPAVLLLLDYWPLRRFERRNSENFTRRVCALFLEKVPFVVLSAITCIITYEVQKHAGAMIMSSHSPLAARIANAFISIARYLGKLFWPSDLAVFYPLPFSWPASYTISAILLALILSIAALGFRRSQPWLTVGWFWFLVTLTPVLGFVQVGAQAMADRYTYIPSIGICLAAVWELAALAELWPSRLKRVMAVLAASALALFVAATHFQLRYWVDSETLFRHALSCTPDNALAHYNLGCTFAEKHRTEEAIRQFEDVLRLDQNIADAHVNLGVMLQAKGNSDEATAHFAQAVRLKPGNTAARNNLGLLLAGQGKTNEALAQYHAALETRPNYPEAHYNLGNLLMQLQDFAGATQHYAAAFQAQPAYPEAHYQFAVACSAMKQNQHAVEHYRDALRAKPDWVEALNNLAWTLATTPEESLRNGPEAARLARHAVEVTKTNNPGALDTLAAALAECGKFSEAISALEEAAALVKTNTQPELVKELQTHLERYRARKPWRE